MQFRTRRLPQFEDVLKELSEMLHVPVAKLFTPDGHKVGRPESIASLDGTLSSILGIVSTRHSCTRPHAAPGLSKTRAPYCGWKVTTHRDL